MIKLKNGDMLKAQWTDRFDGVTKDCFYEVIKVDDVGFFILNDEGNETFPISCSFKKVNF